MKAALAALRPPNPATRSRSRDPNRPKGLNVLGTLAQHPELTTAFHTFNGHVLFALDAHAPPARAARAAGRRPAPAREYEWAQHVVLAGDAGITADEVDARSPRAPTPPGWAPLEAALLRAVDELLADAAVSDATWAALAAELDDAAADGRRLHRRRLRAPGHGLQVLRRRARRRPAGAETAFSVTEIHAIVSPRARPEEVTTMAHFPKPAAGSWTEHYPELGTGPVSYEDSISPAHYELEREAIFRHTWLNVGRVEQLPRKGSYFTKELDAARTSVIVVRGTDGEVRAFHNICRHRGNKLVWNDYPQRGGRRHLPPVHLQVPRLALRPRGRPHLRAAGVGVLRPRQGRLRPRARAGARCGRGSSS